MNYPAPIGHNNCRKYIERALSNLSHAYHFSGIEGIGKKLFAVWIAKHLLCENNLPLWTPCSCPACRQVENDMHPDLYIFSDSNPDKEKKYTAESIRRISEIVDSTSYCGKWKVIILDDAHLLSSGGKHASANALLKNLEEPGSDTIFFLVTHRSDMLLPTILSRCQTVRFNPLSQEEVEEICRENDIKYDRSALTAAGGSIANLISLSDFNINKFLSAVETADIKTLSNLIFDETNRAALPAVIENLRIQLIKKHDRFDSKHIRFIQYLDKFSDELQYNVNMNAMRLDLFANLTELLL
jgi:DNA polymerase-3 subunit delta'